MSSTGIFALGQVDLHHDTCTIRDFHIVDLQSFLIKLLCTFTSTILIKDCFTQMEFKETHSEQGIGIVIFLSALFKYVKYDKKVMIFLNV